MLGSFIAKRLKRSGKAEVKRQVEEELRFHCEMLREEYLKSGMPEDDARAAAARRFGNLKRVQAECVEISRRNSPMKRFLKLVLLVSFLAGVWLRTRGWAVQFTQMGDLFITIGALGQLLLHVKGLRTAGYQALKRGPAFSLLGQGKPSIEAYDELGRTPVERLVADKSHKPS